MGNWKAHLNSTWKKNKGKAGYSYTQAMKDAKKTYKK